MKFIRKRLTAVVMLLILFSATELFAQAGKRYTREQFEALMIDKSRTQVADILGKPDDVSIISGIETWKYKNRFLVDDSVSGKTFKEIRITFRSGKCSSISYYTG